MNATTDSPPTSSTVVTCAEARAGLMFVAILVILLLFIAVLFIIYFVTSNRRLIEKIPGIEKLVALKEKHKRRKQQQSNGLKSAKIYAETTITDAYSTTKSTSNVAANFTTNNKCKERDCEFTDAKTVKQHDVEESSMHEIPLYDPETPTIEKQIFVSSEKRLEADKGAHTITPVNCVETTIVDETAIELELADESFPEPPPIPTQAVELTNANEENGNISGEPIKPANRGDDVTGGSDPTLEKPKLSKMLAEVQNYNSNVSASPRRDDSRLNGNIGGNEGDKGGFFFAPETPNKDDFNINGSSYGSNHKDTVKLSPEQCSTLAANQQRLEAERQQLRQLGII